MLIDRLSELAQTAYAELLDQLVAALPVPSSGSFVSKRIGGTTYWYVQRVDGNRRRQIYLGVESEELLAQMNAAAANRDAAAEDEARRRELIAMLAAAGVNRESRAVGSVLAVLADTGLFRAGAVVVGTHAFGAIGNMLGVRFASQNLRTSDVDLGHPPIAVGVGEMRTDLIEELRLADPRFVAVPPLDPREPSTSFKVRGRDLRVDLLTPGRSDSASPVFLPHLNAAALPLPGLGYLIQASEKAAIVTGGGILVNVPSPARFALHKLWVAGRRNVAEQAKSRKDRRQASELIEVLLRDRPEDLPAAWDQLHHGMKTPIRKALGLIDSGTASALRSVLG
jgi:hypothetical protein